MGSSLNDDSGVFSGWKESFIIQKSFNADYGNGRAIADYSSACEEVERNSSPKKEEIFALLKVKPLKKEFCESEDSVVVWTSGLEVRFDESIRQPLDNLLNDSDLLTLHLPDNEQSKKCIFSPLTSSSCVKPLF